MDTLSSLCRCCLSPDTEVSILDVEQNVNEKFLETTSIEVKEDDGLPLRLCTDCHSIMNTAYQFRKQCIKMDSELKLQLAAILKQTEEAEAEDAVDDPPEPPLATEVDLIDPKITMPDPDIGLEDPHTNTELPEPEESQDAPESLDKEVPTVKAVPLNSADNTMAKLESLIKKEPTDSDDDCYYILVIDDNKDKEKANELANLHNIKIEVPNDKLSNIKIEHHENDEDLHDDNGLNIEASQESSFEKSINSFLVSDTRVPINVPATILENEEGHENDAMEVDDHQDGNSQDMPEMNEDSQDEDMETLQMVDDYAEVITAEELDELAKDKSNFIKILATTGADGTIMLKSNDGGVTYLNDTQLVTANDDGEHGSQEEVILYEGDDSQFQILKCDGSELVIEYADDGQIATVLQQEDGTFLCNCGKSFEDLAEYEKHQYEHNPADDHLCNLCGKGFETAEILTGHMLLHKATGSLIMCPFCNQLMRRNALTQHIKYGHNIVKPKCKICGKTFANPNNLKRHMMIHSGIRDFECDICLKRFHQKITMQTHRLTHMNPTDFSCTECDMTFDNKPDLVSHKDSNECSKSKVIKVKEELMKTVKQEVTTNLGKLLGYACSLCKKMFSLESALEQHIESVHIVDPMELLCSECGEVLPSKKDIQAHMMAHKTMRNKNAKRFECSICSKGCSSQAMLIMHERVHTNERPFPCQLCSLRFKTKTHLRTHQLTHTREKKFGCSVCMKFFALKGNLVVHLRTHTGERPYVCNICGEAFIDSKYLKKHKVKKHAIDNVPWNKY